MSLAIIMPGRSVDTLVSALRSQLPEVAVHVWPDLGPPEALEFAVLWQHPPGMLTELPNLRAVTSYGAGVEFILADEELPPSLTIGRIVDQGLVQQMTAYLQAVVLSRARDLQRYRELQRQGLWQPRSEIVKPRIGILGLGQLGSAAASAFTSIGYSVAAWCRHRRLVEDVEIFQGQEGLLRLAAQSDYLICLLPLTPATAGILNAELFRALPARAYLINVGRGAHLNEADLVAALDQGQLAGAILDVFRDEPLPAGHLFWDHPDIWITPHIASLTDPHRAAAQIAASYRSVQSGQGPLHPVDRQRGY